MCFHINPEIWSAVPGSNRRSPTAKVGVLPDSTNGRLIGAFRLHFDILVPPPGIELGFDDYKSTVMAIIL